MGVQLAEASSLARLVQVSFKLNAGQGRAGEDWRPLCVEAFRDVGAAGLEGDCCLQHCPHPVHVP